MNFAELVGADAYVGDNIRSMPPHDMAQWIECMTSNQDTTPAVERRDESYASFAAGGRSNSDDR